MVFRPELPFQPCYRPKYSHHLVRCTGKFLVDLKVSLIHLSSSKVCHNVNDMFKNVHYDFGVIL